MTQKKRWVAGLALVVLTALVVQLGIPLLFRWSPIRLALRSRLEYAFGRPVEVGSFNLSLLRGLRLEANYITVAEDPRFGQEFFLYADSLTAGIDWPALLRGRLRFARFTFVRPSLNVVISPGSVWNVEKWLESRATAGNAAQRGATAPARPLQIAVSEGRINFKRGVDKQPFSLAELNGTLSPEEGASWRLGFKARLLRAGVALQDAGTIRFQGRLPEAGALPPALPVGARSVAAPPAQFELTWQRASLSDALRLLSGADHGVRGSLEGSLSVRGPTASPNENAPPDGSSESRGPGSDQWSFHVSLRLSGIHRWDLPLRPDNPAVNLDAEGAVAADGALWRVSKLSLEAPRSNLRASGRFGRDIPGETQFRFLSSSVYCDDLFAWFRAFHSGVAERVAFDGYLGVDVELTGWPPRISRGALATDGVRVTVPGIDKKLELSRAVLRVTSNGAELAPLTVSLGDAGGNLRLSAKALPRPGSPALVTLTGETERIEELLAAATALGLTHQQGWRAEGAVRARLRWQGTLAPWRLAPSGTLDFEDAAFRAGALELPIHVEKAHVEMTAAQRRIRIAGADFLGAKWKGTMSATTFDGPWSFSLAADRLNSAEFGRWFPKPAAAGLSVSALPGDDLDPVRLAWPQEFAATGKLSAGDISIGRLRLGKLQATASVADRRLELSPAEAEFYGGRARGTFRAGFNSTPRYDVEARFERVSVSSIVAPHPTLAGCCSGTGQGNIKLSAAGVGREALLKSLAGEGRASVSDGELHDPVWSRLLKSDPLPPGPTQIQNSLAKFVIAGSETRFDELLFHGAGIEAEATGSVSFAGALNFDLRVYDEGRTYPGWKAPPKRYPVTGSLVEPKIESVPQP